MKGLIRGIADNLPGLYDLLKDAGGEALDAFVEGLTSGDVLMKAIPALLVGASLLGAWRQRRRTAGRAAGQGSSVRSRRTPSVERSQAAGH